MTVTPKLSKQQKMKRSFSNSSFFDDDEFEAAEILLQLPQLIVQEKYGFGSPFSFSWGTKRRRSAADSNPLPPHLPSSPPLLSNSFNSSKSSLKVESSSPVTPLSFSPSESDSKPVMVYNRKKTKQEMLEIIQHLGENVRILKQELPKTMAHYEMLKRTNSMLRQMEGELSSCEKQKEHNLNSTPRSITGLALEKVPLSVPVEATEDKENEDKGEQQEGEEEFPVMNRQAEVVLERLTSGSETMESCSFKEPCELKWVSPVMSSGIGFVMAKQLSPLGLPDLNFSTEDSLGIDFSHYYELSKAAIAAQARKRRIEINRYKSCTASVKPRFR
ncbi:uncharacterized protein LOC122661099 isoform X2 [Telopea speciosissima]|uniref:uncharacterized protein LOC122661099 isoform X2 n=1 Tax=Telopea speciosissima TaxID=54955 RepID=UPI001CC541A0|nr:uncharacterized protein LOC122661099 isoform X2 [Telopea speciosissima]